MRPRLFGILLVLAGAILTAAAQTNASANARQVSLQDCIQMALQHNLDLQIDRYDPQIALYAVQATYGSYDPTLLFSAQHDHSESGSQLLTGGFSVPGSITDDNSFNSSLSGVLPWGMTYSLGTTRSISDTYGTSASMVNDPANPLYYRDSTIFTLTNKTLPPQPITVLSTNYSQVPSRSPFESSAGSVGFSVSQPLLKNFWIDTTRLNIRVAKNRLKYSEQLLRLEIMQTVTTLEKAYYDLIYNQENVTVQQKGLEAAQRLVVENRKKVEVGSLAPLDLESAEAQAATSEAALIAARSGLDVQQNLIKQLITGQYSQWKDTAVVSTAALTAPKQFFSRQDSWSKGLSKRPELLQAKLDIEKAGIQLKYDKNQLFPELDIFGTYGYNGTGVEFSGALNDIASTDRPYYSYGARLSLPLAP
jgi:outer membrane protein TolC